MFRFRGRPRSFLSRSQGPATYISQALAATRRNGGSCWPIMDSLGLVYGPELIAQPITPAAWDVGTDSLSLVGNEMLFTAALSVGRCRSLLTVVPGKTYTFNWYGRKGTMTALKYSVYNNTAGSDIVPVTSYVDGFNTVSFVAPAGCTQVFVYYIRDSGSAGTAYFSGASVREVISASLYQDTAGTLPVTTQGQVIGLSLDQSYGSANLGSELVTLNGTAASTANWDYLSVAANQTIAVGDTFRVSGSYTSTNGTGFAGRINGVSLYSDTRVNGTYTFSFQITATAAGSFPIQVGPNGAGTGLVSWSGVSVKQVLGVHLTQPTGANKPTLTRVPKKLGPELVVNGEGSSTAGWTLGNGASLSSQGGEFVLSSSGASYGQFGQQVSVSQGKTYLVTADARRGTDNIGWLLIGTGALGNSSYATLSLTDAQAHLYKIVDATTANLWLTGQTNNSVSGATDYFDNISVREVLEWSNAYLFDGSNDTLTFTPPAITTAATLGWAGTISDLSATRVLFGQALGGAQVYVTTAGAVNIGVNGGSSSTSNPGYIAANSPCVITTGMNTAGTSFVRVNGVQINSTTALNTVMSGTTMALNSQNGSAYFTPGTCLEPMIENSVIPLADLKAWERNACYQLGITYAG